MFSLLACVTLAASAMAIAINPQNMNTTLEKKDFEDARFTWFDVGQGACGGYNYPYEHVSDDVNWSHIHEITSLCDIQVVALNTEVSLVTRLRSHPSS